MARSIVRKTVKKIFIFINICIAVYLLLTYCIPYLNPHHWWWTGFMSLLVPYVVIVLLFFAFFWLIVRPRWALVSIIALLVGWKQASTVFAFHIQSGFNEAKEATALRVVSWNVANLAGTGKNKEKRVHARTEIADVIQRFNPDVICLQEFNNSLAQKGENNLKLFSQAYPYHFFANDLGSDSYQYGSIIFSKYPILHSKRIKFPGDFSESLLYADILKETDTIRIYTTHLQSFLFMGAESRVIEAIREQDKEMWDASKSVVKKMKVAFSRRGVQADMVRKELDKCPYPSVISGDFNDVPNSYTYTRIRDDRQDAFLKKDYGVGRTYLALSPTLRIDYILPDINFTVHQFAMVDEDLSDHLMLVADMSLRK